ncbi:hypothetical protein, conserved in T. vivax [Trypanosoma vivax Y486]|uniref:Uncharacterized protein n=1 Tax=Trypanosoma vivax (strain Y486) TaxID=1055687 RepID=F9WT49_TRYVY|nr:hypothetical protein, conserved in T. vivax [Trypanosoma vivax Y486]|eukprot:CCD20740.1 hypothetical protein, conserved in T. vivax [Trypanosoma vivax Y486]
MVEGTGREATVKRGVGPHGPDTRNARAVQTAKRTHAGVHSEEDAIGHQRDKETCTNTRTHGWQARGRSRKVVDHETRSEHEKTNTKKRASTLKEGSATHQRTTCSRQRAQRECKHHQRARTTPQQHAKHMARMSSTTQKAEKQKTRTHKRSKAAAPHDTRHTSKEKRKDKRKRGIQHRGAQRHTCAISRNARCTTRTTSTKNICTTHKRTHSRTASHKKQKDDKAKDTGSRRQHTAHRRNRALRRKHAKHTKAHDALSTRKKRRHSHTDQSGHNPQRKHNKENNTEAKTKTKRREYG